METKYKIGKKQSAKNSDFLNAWENIESLVSKERIDSLVSDAVKDIKAKVKGKKTAFAWSGGKDSLALQVVCELAGIERSVLCTASAFEYPDFLDWCKKYPSVGLTVIDQKNIDYEWLKKKPHLLFPDSANDTMNWFRAIQHKGQTQYFKENSLDVICLGRRTQDGNYIGSKGENIYTNAQGITRFSPIAHWTHEEVLAAIHYYQDRRLPPIYNHPNGFVAGTGVWPAVRRHEDGIEQNWKELNSLYPSIVREALKHFESAKQFLSL